MIYEWSVFLRAGLFAGAILFANYDMWAALKEIGTSFAGADTVSGHFEAGGRALGKAAIWIYLAEITGGAVFFAAAGFHVFLQKSNDGRHAIWPVELCFIIAAFLFAWFTVGFSKLGGFLFSGG